MLKSVHLENFKLHEDTQIEAAPITVFIGPNNSGKSSVFQALLALRQAASSSSREFLSPARREATSDTQPYLFPENPIIEIGDFTDVARKGEDVIRMGLTSEFSDGNPFIPCLPFRVSVAMDIRKNVLSLHKGDIECGQKRFSWLWWGPGGEHKTLSFATDDGLVVDFTRTDNFALIRLSKFEAPPGMPEDEAVRRATDVSERLAGAPLRVLNSLHSVSPLRGFEEWGYPLPRERAQHLERISLPDRAVALVTTIASNARLKKEFSDRLSELLKIGIDIEYVGSNRVKIFATEEKRGNGQRLFINEGTGASQLPFILIPIALTPKNETVLLSEPEAHLHPKAQCELTRMLLTVAKKENIQFFIETHSEHVLHVILNAVGRGEWAKDDVALHYFENIEGTAKVKRLGINEHGQVDGGLPGFFDQSLAELTEFLDALKKT